MVELTLSGGKGVVKIDDADSHLAQHNWHLNQGYACRYTYENGKQVRHYMHREILGLKPGDGLCADHINRDRFDNRRENLRVVTQQENRQNLSSHRNSTSPYRGVCWDKSVGKWLATVVVGPQGNTTCLLRKHFKVEEDAAAAAAEVRARYMPLATD